jgi:Chaperone of endosialidase
MNAQHDHLDKCFRSEKEKFMRSEPRIKCSRATARVTVWSALIVMVLLAGPQALAQTATFTYQGRLTDGGTGANGVYDLQFGLFDNFSGGSQIGATQTVSNITVSDGVFTVGLNFGSSAFPGANRFLEISARVAGGGAFTLLTPRQHITSTPYAVRSLNATSADALSSACAGCVQDANINAVAGSKVTGTIPVAAVPAGGGNYIQNTGAQQANSNFSISGLGTANIFNAATQYDLAGLRILGTANNSTFLGLFAGSQTTGAGNAFFGNAAGKDNGSGSFNAFFGYTAGTQNTSGSGNAFFGASAGIINTEGARNSFFGGEAGRSNKTGNDNAFFGHQAGFTNSTAQFNSFFGSFAGQSNNTGNDNAFFGYQAGLKNTDGRANSFFGSLAGNGNQSGVGNSAFGYQAGALLKINGGNSFFGSQAGFSNDGIENSFFGANAGFFNFSGNGNSFFGSAAGHITQGSNNTFIGLAAGKANKAGGKNTVLGAEADFGSDNLDHATAIGAEAKVNTSDTIALGRTGGNDTVLVYGKLQIDTLAAAGSTQLCLNGSNRVGTCSSSLRYKTGFAPYQRGLSIINRLHPISFTWKDSGLRDLGFGAEEVLKIDPLLVTYNKEGQVEGVKYDRLSVALVNAVREQQQQIESLRQANAVMTARLKMIEQRLTPKPRRARR